ncbi:MAG: hypothetical protein KF760_09545 [Candidatus Eremiobacteraeota bacterium]|nr:hypothetical protein [Candidatus Eremiobacteraeota bacterium]MCW5866273.1 hypothetical protein [Candidatus Eremiobacteraeota bacterium]
MKKLVVVALGLCLLSTAPLVRADDDEEGKVKTLGWSVYVNGVKSAANSVNVNGMDWFEAQQLVTAIGMSFQSNESGAYANGQPIIPIIRANGVVFTTPEAVAKAAGAVVQKDPVRASIFYQMAASNPGGIPYYSADYIPPAEEYKRQRRADLGMSPGDAMLEDWDEKMGKAWQEKHPNNNLYVPRSPDFVESLPDSSKEMPRLLSEEELLAGASYKGQKPTAQPSGYMTRSADNGTFRVTLNDVKLAEALKGMQPPLYPRAGNKFCVVKLSLQNVTKKRQRPGWFAVRGQDGSPYPANQYYSQFSQGEMAPNETNVGFLIFEIPMSVSPVGLDVLVSPALGLSLLYR